ncbi:MAG: nucleotidyltransferase domain-containing protein [Desulfurococcaceae archaeon]|jgi:predicted nucleotidyltransferase|nr:nucleotidyltransferase domain-containing protein [Desulfurococcaceae archaeon]
MHRYLEYLKMLRVDLEKNLEKYLEIIRNAAQRYEGKAYIFGSYVKGDYIAANNVDIPVEVPDDVDRLQVLHEIRRLVLNTEIQIHVLNKTDAEEFKKIIEIFKEL